MPDQNEKQRAQVRQQQERQYEIDRITAKYADDLRYGRAPRIEDYVQQYPEYARELLEFAMYYHTVGFDASEPEDVQAANLSPAAQQALARIRSRRTAAAAAAAPLEGLVKQAAAIGYSPRTLAEAVGLTTELLGRLEARAISVATIPPTLVRRFAHLLQVTPEAVAAYLGAARAGEGGVFYYADQPPTHQQQSFLDAVQSSALPTERKQEWADVVKHDSSSAP
jgi:hypothetical protein